MLRHYKRRYRIAFTPGQAGAQPFEAQGKHAEPLQGSGGLRAVRDWGAHLWGWAAHL